MSDDYPWAPKGLFCVYSDSQSTPQTFTTALSHDLYTFYDDSVVVECIKDRQEAE